MEDALLRTKSPVIFAKYLEQMPGLNHEYLGKIQSEITKRFSNSQTSQLNSDDIAIIKFFSESSKLGTIKFFRILEAVIMNENALNELQQINPKPPYVSSCVLLWVYLSVYELILDIMTIDLVQQLKESKSQTTGRTINYIINNRLQQIKDEGEHLEAGKINDALSEIGIIARSNNSILGERGRKMRNAIGHGNVRYDSEKDEYIFMDGTTWSSKEFLAEFERLLNFLYGWIYYLNNQSCDIISTIENIFKKQAKELKCFPRCGKEKMYRGFLIWAEGEAIKEERKKTRFGEN